MQKILFGHLRGVAAGGLVRKRQIERRRRAEKSHGRLLVRKACSIFDPGGQKSQVRRLVRNRRFERRRRAEKSHSRLLVRKACSIFDPGGQKSQVRRLVRNRRFERRRRAEKSHSRLLVRKACSIFDPGGQKSQVRQVVRNDARSGTTSAKISQKGGGERESNTDRGVAEVGQYRVESA